MNDKHCQSLELDKVLELLAKEAPCSDCAEMAREITPSTNVEEVRLLLQETSDAHMLIARFGGPSFGGLHSVENALARAAAGGQLNMRELLGIAENLRVIRGLTEWRSHSAGVETILDNRFSALLPNKYLETRITSIIVNEEEIADNASSTLHDIRRKIRAASARVREQLDKLVRGPAQKYLQDPIVTIRSDRFVVPVKAEHRGDVPGLVHDTSASGATVFVEPMSVVETNNDLKVLHSKERAEIDRILMDLSAEAGSFSESIRQSYRLALELALIFTKAHLAYQMKATTPLVSDDGVTEFKQARHPLIDRQKVVPIDIRLGGEFDTLVVTGPNTGGKTVSLKTLGLLTLMAMCGLMIPVGDHSRVSVYDHVLADIGDEQSIEQSLSTFSAHMTNIIHIMEDADDKSLILLDELGAGTDPIEGAALATSILEHLRMRGCHIAATTHYAELKAYALKTDGVENACCEFDVATLRPTYRLLIGVPGRSNAFAISERLGIPREVVDRAREMVSGESTQFEEVVTRLEQSRQAMEQREQEAQALRLEAKRLSDKAQAELDRLKREKERELAAARHQARDLLDKVRRESNALMDELEAIKKQKNSEQFGQMTAKARQSLKSRLRSMETEADPVTEAADNDENYTLPRPLKVQDNVMIRSLGAKGVVLALPDQNDQVLIQSGIIKTRVPLSDLRLLSAKQAKPSGSATRTVKSSSATAKIKTELDLRGQASDEAIMALDGFLDSCVLWGIHEVTVIHGKGTGVLRRAVQQHLKRHPSVRSFRLGVYGEGEDGVTIVELK